jgi:hypothetical protein
MMRLLMRGVTMGTADTAIGKLTGQNEQALTNESYSRMGALGMIPEGLGYVLGPSKYTAIKGAGQVGGAAISGAITGGINAWNQGDSVPEGMLKGGVANVATIPAARAIQGIGVAGLNLIRKAPKTAADVAQALQDSWKPVNSATYGSGDMKATARSARIGATQPADPMVSNPPSAASKLFDQFEEYTNDASQLHSVKELRAWQAKANDLTGDDAQYGKVLSDRIDAMLQQGTPATTPRGVLAGHVQATAQAAQRGKELLGQYDANLALNPNTIPGYIGAQIRPHSFGTAHRVGAPLMEAIFAGAEGHHAAGVPGALMGVAGTLAGQPIINAGADFLRNQGERTAAAEAMRKAAGQGTPDFSDAIRKMIMGGYFNRQNQ